MRQPVIIHEHYDPVPWLSIIAEVLTIVLLVSSRGSSLTEDVSPAVPWVFKLIVFGAPLAFLVLILIYSVYWRNKPTIVVYNDRLEVRKPYAFKRCEMLYSDIRNVDRVSGQLLIWNDDISAPSRYNLGINAKRAEETFKYIRTSFDKYGLENNIKPAPIESLPKNKTGLPQVVFIVTMLAVLTLLFILS